MNWARIGHSWILFFLFMEECVQIESIIMIYYFATWIYQSYFYDLLFCYLDLQTIFFFGCILFLWFIEEDWVQIELAIMIHPFATWICQPSFLWLHFINLVRGRGVAANWISHYDPSFCYLDLPTIFFFVIVFPYTIKDDAKLYEHFDFFIIIL